MKVGGKGFGQITAVGFPAEVFGIDDDDSRVAGAQFGHPVRILQIRLGEQVLVNSETQLAFDPGVADPDEPCGRRSPRSWFDGPSTP